MRKNIFWLLFGFWLNTNLAFAQNESSSEVPDIFLKVKVIPETVYVRAQFIYTIRLYSRVSLASTPMLSEFEIEHAEVQKLKANYFDETIQGETYQVDEQHYAIFPEKSGQLIIPAMSVTTTFKECPEYYCSVEEITLNSKPIPIAVQPKSSEFQIHWLWLPAQSLVLEEKWIFKRPFFQVGKSVTRILTLQATGLSAKQLPKISLPTPVGINSYLPEKPKSPVENFADNGVVNSQYQQTFTLEPTKAGNYTLPKIEIPWWDTKNQQLNFATLPAHAIYVLPLTSHAEGMSGEMWLWLSGSLNLGLIILVLFGWWQRHDIPVRQKSISLPDDIKTARKNLKRACEKNDPKKAQQALLAWAATYWTGIFVQNLGNVAAQLNDTEVQAALNNLDYILYSNKKIEWNGKAFWEVIAKNMGNTRNGRKVSTSLPQLYYNS